MNLDELTPGDLLAVDSFRNFLSWSEKPSRPGFQVAGRQQVPPAWYAYARGFTQWCPPKGEW